tara:strand:- start:129 stop:707 length:579 start_codon:yes stop_codon:yes gene_type:complete
MIDYLIYHYCIDDFNDVGFGCSYRNIQTILSAVKKYYKNDISIPNVKSILKYFNNDYEKKIKQGKTQELWIEPYHISEYLKNYYKIKGQNILYLLEDQDISKILKTDIFIYLSDSIYHKSNFNKVLEIINEHFNKNKIPIVIDNGVYSYCLTKINENFILIDPHTTNDDNATKIIDEVFLKNSFWMVYLPIL